MRDTSKAILLALPLLLIAGVASAHFSSGDLDPYFYTVVHTSPYDPPIAGQLSQVFVSIFNTSSGEPVSDLDVVHERRLHIFVLSGDFEHFAHFHPDDFPLGLNDSYKGVYSAFYAFPDTGRYLMVVDYTVNGRNALKSFQIDAYSERGTSESVMGPPVVDYSRSGSFDGYDVSLEAPVEIRPRVEVPLDFRIERDGTEVTDLQNLLGSAMHVVVARTDLTNASHTHAYIPSHTLHVGSMAQRYYGPVVPVRFTFPSGGDYVVFGQFRHDDRIVTTKFFVHVKEDLLESIAVNLVGYSSIIIILIFVIVVFRDEIRGVLSRGKAKKSRKN